MNFGNKINVMTQAYIAKLGLAPRTTHVDTQKIDSLALKTYEITTVGFSIVDKLG